MAPKKNKPSVLSTSWKSWRWKDVVLPSLASAVMLFLSFAPLQQSWLAWFAPLGWVSIIASPHPLQRKDYWGIWLTGCVFWLLILQGIRLAFWPLYLGWVALALYLAVYLPLFVACSRLAILRLNFPLALAIPISWCGFEWMRTFLFTGFGTNTLAQSQANHPLVIQCIDQIGGIGLSFCMLLVCSCIYMIGKALSERKQKPAWKSLTTHTLIAGSVLAYLVGYGDYKLKQGQEIAKNAKPLLKVLLVQENTPTIFENNLERTRRAWQSYLQQTRNGIDQHGPVDLIVWPESTFTAGEPLVQEQLDGDLPDEIKAQQFSRDAFQQRMLELSSSFNFKVDRLRRAASPPSEIADETPPAPWLMLGCDYWLVTSEMVKRTNSAILVTDQGVVDKIYSKMHLVMFGEYIPLGPLLGWVGDIFGLPQILPGEKIEAFRIPTSDQQGQVQSAVTIAPSICFESALPRLIRWHVQELRNAGKPPQVLINITNDSWFRGSSILDHHLAAAVFCAVENRRPLLMAGNTGLSAHIDANGQIVSLADRFESTTLLAEPTADGRTGLVQAFGYPIGWVCGLCCAGFSLLLILNYRKLRTPSSSP